jgi:hypothetical protein
MDKRFSIRRKAGKSRAHTNARTEPVINAAVTVRRQEQPDRAREPREDIYTRRKLNPASSTNRRNRFAHHARTRRIGKISMG